MSKHYKRYLDADEWYPVYSLLKRDAGYGGPALEFTAEEIDDYEATVAKFQEWQGRLRQLSPRQGQRAG